MKKTEKFLLLGIIILSLSACGKDDQTENSTVETEATVKLETDMESESPTEEKSSEQESFLETYKRFMVGDTIQFENGLEVYILDVGIYNETFSGNGVYVYVDLELKNNGKEAMDFSDSFVEFYGDNYKIRGDISPVTANDKLGNVSINVGRQARGRCYVQCNDYDNYSVIEAQISDAIIVMKDDTIYANPSDETLPVEDSKSIYGIYSVDNGVNAVLSGEVGVYTDGTGDYIRLEALSYGDRYIAQFNGILTQVDENTYQSKDDNFGTVITVVFDGSGMQVNVEEVPAEDFYELNGYYEKTGDIIRS